ncbi:MAG: hypothetical protein IPH57_16210 [Saprospiraceae bacterium]|nr:hypothetical protein [Saprospiraceae bacterium]
MKNNFISLRFMIVLAGFLAVFAFVSCTKDDDDDDDDNNSALIWNENWLIGTWEGTTPSTVQPFANKKIKIVFNKAFLYKTEVVEGNTIKTFAYSGTFTWDVSGSSWTMNFVDSDYPVSGNNFIGWQSAEMVQANVSTNLISLRISDLSQTDPWHSFELDWGPYVDYNKGAPTIIDLYGDIEIETGGNLQRADYPPTTGKMIRLTKK